MSEPSPAVDAWRRFQVAARDLIAVLKVDFTAVEAIAHAEVESLLRETADEWDDVSRARTLITRFGLDPVLEFAKAATTKFLRKWISQDA